MKRITLLTSFALLAVVFLSSCVKNVSPNYDDSYWLNQERADVVFADSYCSYYVVETNYGYTLIRSRSSYLPYEGSVMYGNFGGYATRDFYDRTQGVVVTGEIVEYDLSYADAQAAIHYYCPYSKTAVLKQSASANSKIARPASTPTTK